MTKKKLVIALAPLILIGGALSFYLSKRPDPIRPPASPSSFTASFLKVQGYSLLQQKKLKEALPLLHRASELDPKDKKLKALLKELDPVLVSLEKKQESSE